ncbi:PGF-CTERM sorting domain-containing protein [Haloarchaeobius sp. HME9146]|uniref:DUF7827 domain-containing protein n=1 Tax=Haloarchaeobius sp. HME9146 TaxID=2978732 RepID=UPI0021C0C068|nr:PGF-CTERM sorting domain-containing protein [Haloarchaeobius sp. HME9146]MCT9095011.1 PGF-CTERM sorting domain-containing protein [Haloarchaeobius sp. HME9146]
MHRTALQSICCIALLAVAAAGAPAVTAAEPDATFDKSVYETPRDEAVTLTLTLTDAENATVSLGSEDAGFQMNVTVHDNTSDGQVRLTIYTQRLGIRAPAKAVSVAGNDSIVSASGDTLGGAIDAGDYELVASVNGTQTDVATLSVTEPTTTTPTTSDTPATTTRSSTTTAATTTTAADATDEDDGSSSAIPGFGLGVTVVALASVALLARRR